MLWREQRAPHAPGPMRRDWVLVAAVCAVCLAEAIFRDSPVSRAAPALFMAALAFGLPWRRVRPLNTVLLLFGINAIPQIGGRMLDIEWTPVAASVFLLILPYSLLRWSSGREAFVGLGFVFVTFALTIGASGVPAREVVAGVLFLLFPAALGASVRYRDAAQHRAQEQVRLQEREQLARELHDTVAHHVSAIAIQAQAGRTLAATQAQAPLEALALIEQAASNTLTEMRRMVRTMRSEADAQLAPAATLADIRKLANDNTGPLDIIVDIEGDLDDLDSTLVSTLYRLTQESMTNTLRHADAARTLSVLIHGTEQEVQLTIKDDGSKVTRPGPRGFGLRGMSERATLLGGTLSAGPAEQGGWVVRASLPRSEKGL